MEEGIEDGVCYGIMLGCAMVALISIALLSLAVSGYKEYQSLEEKYQLDKVASIKAYLNLNFTPCWEWIGNQTKEKDGIYYYMPTSKINCTPMGYYNASDNSIHINLLYSKKQQLETICHERIHQRHYKAGMELNKEEETLTRKEEMEECI